MNLTELLAMPPFLERDALIRRERRRLLEQHAKKARQAGAISADIGSLANMILKSLPRDPAVICAARRAVLLEEVTLYEMNRRRARRAAEDLVA